MSVTGSRGGRAASGGRGAGAFTGRTSPDFTQSMSRASATYMPPRSIIAFAASSPASARSRCSQRDSTVGVPSRFSARVTITRGAAIASAKSWAERPRRRSGGGRPMPARMARDSQGSVRVAAGHTPSSSPPRMRRSTDCSRASSVPQMWMRGSAPNGRWTAASSRRAVRKNGYSDGAMASSLPSGSSMRPVSSSASALPSAPCQSAPSAPASSEAAAASAVSNRSVAADTEIGPLAAKAASTGPRAAARRSASRSASCQSSGVRRRRAMGTCASAANAARAFSRAAVRPTTPPVRRWPRKRATSSRRAARRQSARSMPKAAWGCLRSASSPTGSALGTATSASRRANTPAGSPESGAPAELSTASFQRASSTATRRAMARSGVTSATVVSGFSTASRIASAMAVASSCSLRATMRSMPASASAAGIV